MFENGAVTKCGRAGIEKYEENVAGGGSAAESVKVVALDFEGRNLLRLEFGFYRRRIELTERDTHGVVSAPAADVGPGDLFHLRIRIHAGGAQKLFELAEFGRQHLAVELREPGKFARGFQVSVSKFADGFWEHADDGRAKRSGRAARGRNCDGAEHQSECQKA